MPGTKALPIVALLALGVGGPLLSTYFGGSVFTSMASQGIVAESDAKRFEATAVVKSIKVLCEYKKWLIKTPGPKLTGFVPCVSKEEIAERTGTPVGKVSFSKFTVATLDVTEATLPQREGYILLKFHFVGGDPTAIGRTQDRFKDLTLKPGDRLLVSYLAKEPDPKKEIFFNVEHLD